MLHCTLTFRGDYYQLYFTYTATLNTYTFHNGNTFISRHSYQHLALVRHVFTIRDSNYFNPNTLVYTHTHTHTLGRISHASQ